MEAVRTPEEYFVAFFFPRVLRTDVREGHRSLRVGGKE